MKALAGTQIAERAAKLLLAGGAGLSLTVLAAMPAQAQAGGAPMSAQTGRAESPPGTSGQQPVEEAPYPGGTGPRVKEAPRPGTIDPREVERLKRSPGRSDGGTAVDPPAR